MYVGVNALTIEPTRGGGEEHYLRNVLATLRRVHPDVRFVVFTDVTNHDSFEGWDRIYLRGTSELERAVKRARIDLLFTPLRTALVKSPAPQVPFAMELLSVRELAARRHRRDAARLKAIQRICKEAAAIVAPSQFLQRECLELLEVPLDKVSVAPLGVHEAFGTPQPCIAQQPYILSVGDTHGFKNISRLRAALASLKDEMPHTLIVVGQPAEAEPEDWGRRVVRVHRCPTAHLAGLYQHCDAFVCASLYEGSGVVVVEAMRAGAPVVTSRVGGIPEVAGDTPLYLNPENISSIAAAIRRIIEENPKSREQRTRFGKQLAAEFTWEKCAWKTLAAFRRA